MMKMLPLEASDQEILDAIRQWVGLLIEERYVDACEFLFQPTVSHCWTPELIAALIHNYGSVEPYNGSIYRVTSLDDVNVDHPDYAPLRHDVHRFSSTSPGSGVGYIWFDLPLNGHSSDLTATFDFCIVNHQLAFVLNDIHVM